MKDKASGEINRGYLEFISGISKQDKKFNSLLRKIVSRGLTLLSLLCIPLIFVYGLVLVLFLAIRTASTRKKLKGLHKQALPYVDEFIEQYPFHLYPIVAKSLELAFLRECLPGYVKRSPRGIVEMAIGDGSLSKRIFSDTDKVTGFDLNPYSLIHASKLSHVEKSVVSDCMNPPLSENSVDLLLSNNLLHHVSNKEYVVGNWARVAKVAIFNENTAYWASGWTMPFLLKSLGMVSWSQKQVDTLCNKGLQTLLSKEELDRIVSGNFEILQEATFMSEKTFFLCAISSTLLGCYGPPTPRIPKLIFNKLLRPFAHGLTRLMARFLLYYDAEQDRSRDTFVFWVGRSKGQSLDVGKPLQFVCPDCRVPLNNNMCPRCKSGFSEQEGMLFLLPSEMRDKMNFDASKIDSLGKEHL